MKLMPGMFTLSIRDAMENPNGLEGLIDSELAVVMCLKKREGTTNEGSLAGAAAGYSLMERSQPAILRARDRLITKGIIIQDGRKCKLSKEFSDKLDGIIADLEMKYGVSFDGLLFE